jgi:predicted O-methyltransferase YrrM
MCKKDTARKLERGTKSYLANLKIDLSKVDKMITVVCVYNNERLLYKCLLNSLENQTVNYELILVDNTQGQFKSAAEALNYGGKRAHGDYIMFVHQDVELSSKSWLEETERILHGLPNLGIAGVAGKSSGKGIITNILHGDPPKEAGKIHIREPIKVQTLDECLVIVPKNVFANLKFDDKTCNRWHLYAVDYCLSAKEHGFDIYALPSIIYHKSRGIKPKTKLRLVLDFGEYSKDYYLILKKVLRKHKNHYKRVYATTGNWNTSLPLILQRVRQVMPTFLGLIGDAPIIAHILAGLAFTKLRLKTSNVITMEDYVDVTFNCNLSIFPFKSIKIEPLQVREEIIRLLKILMKHRPKLILEIGTFSGGTLFLFSRVAAPDATLISVDSSSEEGYHNWRGYLYRSFVSKKQKIHLIRAGSYDLETFKEVKNLISNNKLDFLLIDSNHTYEDVRKNFEMYFSLVRKGGIIALHDIVPRSPETGYGVNKFWSEIKVKYNHIEIVKDWEQGWGGIGIIYI